jgi:arginase
VTAPRLIQVPYHLGRPTGGLADGVPVLAAALEDGASGVAVVECTDEYRNEPGACFGVVRALAPLVRAATADAALPVVLAANCHSCLGTVAGLEGELGAVWLDAHADFHTSDSTESGFFDAMALSMLVGQGWRTLRSSVAGLRPLAPQNVVLLGARDVDTGEEERLSRSAIRRVGLDELEEALDGLRARVDAVYLHIDLDVLDPSVGRANWWAVAGGLGVDELAGVVDRVAERLAIRAAAFTAYAPQCDPAGAIPDAAHAAYSRLRAASGVAA